MVCNVIRVIALCTGGYGRGETSEFLPENLRRAH